MKTYAPPKLRQTVTEAVFRRQRIFLLTLVCVMVPVVLLVLLMPRKYEADAKLMVQNVRGENPLSTNPSERVVQPDEVSATQVNSEVDLLESNGVARRALGQNVNAPETRYQDDAVTELQRHLTVEPVHQTNDINVKLLGSSPADATRQLQSLLDAYFLERAGAERSSGAAVFFDKQAEDKAGQLEDDQRDLTAFEVQHQIADLDDQKKLQVQRIGALEDQLAATNAALAQRQSQTASEKRELSLTPARSKTLERSITNQYSQERLNTSLVDLENKRTELMKRYQPSDRQIVEVNQQIATTQQAIALAANSPAGETATDVNPTYQELTSAVAASSGQLSGLAAQRAELQRQHTAAQARLDELSQATEPYDELKRKADQARADYTVYAQKRDEARISEALDKEKMLDVALVQPPVASPVAVRPKPLLYLLAGLAFALLLGTLLALYGDSSAEQVYTPAQLDALTGTRTVATFSDEDDADHHADNNRLEYRRLLFAIRSALEGATPNPAPGIGHCVAFTSALAGEGVTHLVTHLAQEGSRQVGTRIAVLDMKRLWHTFETDENVSFAMRFDAAAQYWVLALKGDDAIDGAPLRQGGTQGQFSARLAPLLREARKEFEFVFLDCPSFQESTLAVELDVCVDGYVAVVSAGSARKQNLEQMMAVLRESRAPLLGYVLNRRQYPVPEWMHRVLW